MHRNDAHKGLKHVDLLALAHIDPLSALIESSFRRKSAQTQVRTIVGQSLPEVVSSLVMTNLAALPQAKPVGPKPEMVTQTPKTTKVSKYVDVDPKVKAVAKKSYSDILALMPYGYGKATAGPTYREVMGAKNVTAARKLAKDAVAAAKALAATL